MSFPTRCCGSSSTNYGTSRARQASRPIRGAPGGGAIRPINRQFAQAVADSIPDTDRPVIVLPQDYHLYLLPAFLRELVGDNVQIQPFVHIPWPGIDAWRILPEEMRDEILTSMLAGRPRWLSDVKGRLQLRPELPLLSPRAFTRAAPATPCSTVTRPPKPRPTLFRWTSKQPRAWSKKPRPSC